MGVGQMSLVSRVVYVAETPQERRRRLALERAIKRRARARYAIQINLSGPNDGKIYPMCWLTFVCRSKEDAWDYLNKVNPMKFFPNARSASVEYIYT